MQLLDWRIYHIPPLNVEIQSIDGDFLGLPSGKILDFRAMLERRTGINSKQIWFKNLILHKYRINHSNMKKKVSKLQP